MSSKSTTTVSQDEEPHRTAHFDHIQHPTPPRTTMRHHEPITLEQELAPPTSPDFLSMSGLQWLSQDEFNFLSPFATGMPEGEVFQSTEQARSPHHMSNVVFDNDKQTGSYEAISSSNLALSPSDLPLIPATVESNHGRVSLEADANPRQQVAVYPPEPTDEHHAAPVRGFESALESSIARIPGATRTLGPTETLPGDLGQIASSILKPCYTTIYFDTFHLEWNLLHKKRYLEVQSPPFLQLSICLVGALVQHSAGRQDLVRLHRWLLQDLHVALVRVRAPLNTMVIFG
jgi:hypothetical protein